MSALWMQWLDVEEQNVHTDEDNERVSSILKVIFQNFLYFFLLSEICERLHECEFVASSNDI